MNPKMPVVCIYEDGTHKEYESMSEAARKENVSAPTVRSLVESGLMGTCGKIFVPKSEFFEGMCSGECIQSAKDAHYAGLKIGITGVDEDLEFQEYVSIKDVAETYHVSDSSVSRWCESHLKRFGLVWFRSDELNDLKMSELQRIVMNASDKYCPERYK